MADYIEHPVYVSESDDGRILIVSVSEPRFAFEAENRDEAILKATQAWEFFDSYQGRKSKDLSPKRTVEIDLKSYKKLNIKTAVYAQ